MKSGTFRSRKVTVSRARCASAPSCCCCSKVLRRHMAHRPSTSFMSVLYNLAKWLFLYSAYFSSPFFLIFFHFFIFFFGPQALFFLLTYMFFCFAALFFHQYIHNYLQ